MLKKTLTITTKNNQPSRVPAKVETAARDLMARILNYHGVDGAWTLSPVNHVRVRADVAFRLKTSDRTGILVMIKPGDNGTAWEWRLCGPKDCWLLPQIRLLGLWSGWDGRDVPAAVKSVATEEEPGEDDSDDDDLGRVLAAARRNKQRKALLKAATDELVMFREEAARIAATIAELSAEAESLKEEAAAAQSRIDEIEREASTDRDARRAAQLMALMQESIQ